MVLCIVLIPARGYGLTIRGTWPCARFSLFKLHNMALYTLSVHHLVRCLSQVRSDVASLEKYYLLFFFPQVSAKAYKIRITRKECKSIVLFFEPYRVHRYLHVKVAFRNVDINTVCVCESRAGVGRDFFRFEVVAYFLYRLGKYSALFQNMFFRSDEILRIVFSVGG